MPSAAFSDSPPPLPPKRLLRPNQERHRHTQPPVSSPSRHSEINSPRLHPTPTASQTVQTHLEEVLHVLDGVLLPPGRELLMTLTNQVLEYPRRHHHLHGRIVSLVRALARGFPGSFPGRFGGRGDGGGVRVLPGEQGRHDLRHLNQRRGKVGQQETGVPSARQHLEAHERSSPWDMNHDRQT